MTGCRAVFQLFSCVFSKDFVWGLCHLSSTIDGKRWLTKYPASIGILHLELYGKFINHTPRLYVARALFAIYRFHNLYIDHVIVMYGIFHEICTRIRLSLSGCGYIIIPLLLLRLIFQYLRSWFTGIRETVWQSYNCPVRIKERELGPIKQYIATKTPWSANSGLIIWSIMNILLTSYATYTSTLLYILFLFLLLPHT